MTVTCPVCRRPAQVTETGRVRRHRDGAHRVCVMFGHHMPLDEEERRAG